MDVTPTQVLERTLEILSGPEKWTQGHEARATNGYSVSVLDPAAVCYCTIGAASRAYYDLAGDTAYVFDPLDGALKLISRALNRYRDTAIAPWNDTTGRRFSEVRAVIERAYELSKQAA